MRTIALICLVAGSGIGLLITGCGGTPPEKEPVIRPVKIHAIGSLEPEAMREFPGTIRAIQTADMGFEVPGRVIEFNVEEGDAVEQDAVLAKLDPRDYQQQLNAAQANLDKAQAELDTELKIKAEDEGATSETIINEKKRAVSVSKAQLEIAKKALDDTELKAPFAGRMARKLVEDFANVLAKEPVLILQDTSTLEIEVAVPERDIARHKNMDETKEQMTERLKPKVILSSLPDREFPAWIKEFATAADPVTRTFAFRLNFENPEDVTILPGMTARVRVVIDPESAWSVPVTAAQADENEQPYVWKVDPASMKVASAPVELGPLTGDRVLLTGGVEKGDLVAISGVTALREGMQVRKFEN